MKSSRTDRVWLGLALLLFLLQVLPFLGDRWVTDESWYAAPAYSVAHGNGLRDPALGPNDLENHLDVRPPGTALTVSVFLRILGTSAVTARLASVLAGLCGLLLLYRLTHGLLGVEGARIATFLFATDNLLAITARSTRPEALTVAWILAALLALELYRRSGKLAFAALAGLLMAITTMYHITVLGYIAALGLLFAIVDWNRTPRRVPVGVAAYGVTYLVGLLPFAFWVLGQPQGPNAFHAEYLARASGSVLSKFMDEGRRYNDFFGLGMLHGHGLEHLPVRLPIPLCIFAGLVLLLLYARRWFFLSLALLVPTMLWLAYTVNKSSRYLVLLAPVFAFIVSAAVTAVRGRPRLHRITLTAAILMIAAQAGANLYLLKGASDARYQATGTALDRLLPPGAPVYGAIEFWLALRDHPFVAYERTTPLEAAQDDHVRYFIFGDRTMTQGYAGEDDFYQTLRENAEQIEARSTLVGSVDDRYYGHLTVYRLNP